MSHSSDKPHDETWNIDQNNTVKYLREHWKVDFTEEEIQHVIGILEVNAFEVNGGRGVFPLTALMSHDCVANARYMIVPSFLKLVCWIRN